VSRGGEGPQYATLPAAITGVAYAEAVKECHRATLSSCGHRLAAMAALLLAMRANGCDPWGMSAAVVAVVILNRLGNMLAQWRWPT